jgi:hypothetical protein
MAADRRPSAAFIPFRQVTLEIPPVRQARQPVEISKPFEFGRHRILGGR